MAIYNREDEYIKLLSEREHTVKELSDKLFISEPTVRRDIIVLRDKEILDCKRGVVRLRLSTPDERVPMFLRNLAHTEEKNAIARKCAAHIKDGYTLMLDASTSAYCLVPYLASFKNLFVITNGAHTAIALAAMGIKTLSVGGEITSDSYCFYGPDAERTVSAYNADVAIFSCRGINEQGALTDSTIFENSIRRIMMQNSRKRIALCDSSKFGKTYLHTLCHTRDVDEIISDSPLPSYARPSSV